MRYINFLMLGPILLIVHAASVRVQAQQHPIYSQYMFNGLVINPAYAGSHGSMTLTATARKQWAGLQGAPETQVFTLHTPVKFSRSSTGVMLVHDQAGPISQYNLSGVYAYRIPVSKHGRFAVGAQGGMTYYQANFSELNIITPDNQPDPAFAGNESRMMPNLGLGMYYHDKKKYIGLAVPAVINNRWNLQDPSLRATQQRHYFLSAGYIFDLNRDLKLKPNVLLRWVEGGAFQYDINANMLIREVLWAGLSYRMNDAVDIIFEYNITNQLSFGYSYGHPTSRLAAYQSGTHELLVNYRIKKNKNIVFSPRYF